MTVLLGCKKTSSLSSQDYMVFDEIVYKGKDISSVSLHNETDVNIDVIGITDFYIKDSLMVLSTQNPDAFLSFVSLPTYRILGSFLKKGQGPLEFLSSPSISYNSRFFYVENELFAYLLDRRKGSVYRFNVTKSLRNNKIEMSLIKDNIPRSAFGVVTIDDTKFLFKELNEKMVKQSRYILDNNIKTVPPFLEKLNQATIKQGEDFNILATMIQYDPQRDMIVEMPLELNYLNMYSLDGSIAKTICIDKELYDIKNIQNIARGDRNDTFADIRLFKNFFAILYMNETQKDFIQFKRKGFPTVLLFDWSGNMIAQIKLNQLATSFDFDMKNKTLYTFDHQTEGFYKYDVADILSKILKNEVFN